MKKEVYERLVYYIDKITRQRGASSDTNLMYMPTRITSMMRCARAFDDVEMLDVAYKVVCKMKDVQPKYGNSTLGFATSSSDKDWVIDMLYRVIMNSIYKEEQVNSASLEEFKKQDIMKSCRGEKSWLDVMYNNSRMTDLLIYCCNAEDYDFIMEHGIPETEPICLDRKFKPIEKSFVTRNVDYSAITDINSSCAINNPFAASLLNFNFIPQTLIMLARSYGIDINISPRNKDKVLERIDELIEIYRNDETRKHLSSTEDLLKDLDRLKELVNKYCSERNSYIAIFKVIPGEGSRISKGSFINWNEYYSKAYHVITDHSDNNVPHIRPEDFEIFEIPLYAPLKKEVTLDVND